MKHAASGAAAMAAGIALLLALRKPPAATLVAVENPATVSVLEIMSDEDLLAALQDQPVLLLKDETGITGVVFLADTSPAANQLPRGL